MNWAIYLCHSLGLNNEKEKLKVAVSELKRRRL
jgi:hypothetical protein